MTVISLQPASVAAVQPSGRFLPSLALLTGLAAVVCGLTLRFVFPGYFDPGTAYHIDHFSYVGMHDVGYGSFVRYLSDYPRPIGYVLIHQCGRLGMHALFIPLFLIYCANLALLALYVARILGGRVAAWSFLLYAALVFAHPRFYWNVKDDPFAVFSLTFLLGVAHCWQSYVETGRLRFLIAALVCALLFSETKESYFCVLGLFVLLQCILVRRHARAAAIVALASFAFMGLALYRAAHLWTLFHGERAAGDPYATSLAPLSMLHGYVSIGRHLVSPAVAAALALLLLVAWRRDRAVFMVCVVALACAGASLLPNATLPNHLLTQYAGLGLAFLYAPLLTIDRLLPPGRWPRVLAAIGAVALYAVVLLEHRRAVDGEPSWLRDQEVIARRLMNTLDVMRDETPPAQSALVAGMSMPFNPFLAPYFIRGHMQAGTNWTVIVADGLPERSESTTRVIHASNPLAAAAYDHLYVVAPEGTLARIFASPGPGVIRDELAARGIVIPADPGPR